MVQVTCKLDIRASKLPAIMDLPVQSSPVAGLGWAGAGQVCKLCKLCHILTGVCYRYVAADISGKEGVVTQLQQTWGGGFSILAAYYYY